MRYQLTLDTLKHLDLGKADVAFTAALKRCVQDCDDRPADARPRKVVLEVSCVPEVEPSGECSLVNTQIQVTSKVPTHRTTVYKMGLNKGGSLVFSEDDADYSRPGMFEEQ